MAKALPVNRVVNVTMNLAPKAAPTRNFGAGLIIGGTDVIDVTERVRAYADMTGVAGDFGVNDHEYKAAAIYFSQTPQPAVLYIGRAARSATRAVLKGGVLSAAEQAMSNFTGITNGSFAISIDGAAVQQITAINLGAQTNLNGVAAQIQSRLPGGFSCIWDANNGRFVIKGATTGTSATLSYATAPAAGVDVSALLKLTSGLASAPVAGIAQETLTQTINAMIDNSSDWYAALPVGTFTEDEIVDAAGIIQAQSKKRRLGITTQNANALDPQITSDLASRLKQLGYYRAFVQYSSSSPYAVVSFFARAATVNFEAENTTITLKFKVEPGVAAETLTVTQANTLAAKNINVFVNYDNSTAIIQEGVNADGSYFDEWHGLDWLENAVQTAVWNLLYTSTTKIPQTDSGTNRIVTTVERTCEGGVRNGLLAPGKWNGPGFGQLATGDMLSKGFYVYAQPVALQSQADREARKSVPIQVAAKLAGAVHSVDALFTINR